MLGLRTSAAVLIAALSVGSALGAPASQAVPAQTGTQAQRQAPLPPAGAAPSVREAQALVRPLLYWAAGGLAIVAGVILLYDSPDDDTTTTATTGTN